MRDVVLTLLVFGALPFALFSPFVGVLVWTWLSVMNPHRLTWGFAYQMPFAQIVAIVTLVSLAFNTSKLRFPVNGVTVTMILFTLWMCVTHALSFHPELGYEMWTRVMKTLLMTLVAAAVVRSEREIRIFVALLMLCVAFYGVKGGIFTIATGGQARVWGPPESHIADNNSISVALVMMIPLMFFLLHQSHRWIVRWALVATMLLCAASVIASYSRGAFIAGTAMLTFLALKSRRRGLFLAFVIVAVVGIALAMPDQWWARMATIFSDNPDDSVRGRFNAWWMTWNLALDRPVIGGGYAIYEPDIFARYAPDPMSIHSAHSIYFQMLGEHGFVGLTLYLLLALLGWLTGRRVIAGSTTPEVAWRAELARALQVAMVGFFVGGLTVNIGYWDVYYFLLVALVALEQLVRAEAAAQPAVVASAEPTALAQTRAPT